MYIEPPTPPPKKSFPRAAALLIGIFGAIAAIVIVFGIESTFFASYHAGIVAVCSIGCIVYGLRGK